MGKAGFASSAVGIPVTIQALTDRESNTQGSTLSTKPQHTSDRAEPRRGVDLNSPQKHVEFGALYEAIQEMTNHPKSIPTKTLNPKPLNPKP